MNEPDFKQHYIDRMTETTGLSEEKCRDFVWDIIDNYKQMFNVNVDKARLDSYQKGFDAATQSLIAANNEMQKYKIE